MFRRSLLKLEFQEKSLEPKSQENSLEAREYSVRASKNLEFLLLQNVQDSASTAVQQQAGVKAGKGGDRMSTASLSDFLQGSDNLKVCVFTADFWGLKSAGGTATAYHLLAELLAKSPGLQVRELLAATDV